MYFDGNSKLWYSDNTLVLRSVKGKTHKIIGFFEGWTTKKGEGG